MASGNDQARLELAAMAARYIADAGLDYGQAKARAAREMFGGRAPKGSQPDNDEVDAALREHLDLFDEDHAARVRRLREAALDLMERLDGFTPLVTGAAWKGIAAEHAPIHLQLFHDNPKDVVFFLLDARVPFDATTAPHFRGHGEVEAIELLWREQPVLISLYHHDELRGAIRGGDQALRGDRAALAARLAGASA